MKLLNKIGVNQLLFTALLLVLAGLLIYFQMASILREETTEKLLVNRERIIQQIQDGDPIATLPPVIEVERISNGATTEVSIRDTTLYDPIEDEMEPFVEVTGIQTIGGDNYRITLRQVTLEPHDYFNSIGAALGLVLLMLLLGLFIANRYIFRKTWKPFYANLEILKNYSIQETEPIALVPSGIKEFSELNRVVEQLSDRVRSDFRAMKEFSENASHEMQTPLAIIRSKLEVLLQDPQLSQTISAEVHAALNAVQRLSRMNQALLLITKIEHGQFSEVHEILVGDVIHRQLDELSELMRLKELKVNWERNEAVTVHAHPELSEILISNLVGNAIKHNAKKGEITIDVHPGGFSITNTSPSVVSQPSEMFRRFSKADASSTSLGLGLSISEKICHRYGWRITYSTNGNKHTVSVNF